MMRSARPADFSISASIVSRSLSVSISISSGMRDEVIGDREARDALVTARDDNGPVNIREARAPESVAWAPCLLRRRCVNRQSLTTSNCKTVEAARAR
jgi:hypothetical protein